MAQVQRQRFSIFHNELLDFLIANAGPGAQRAAAVHFNVTESTISVIVNSDIFQAKLRDRQDAKHEAVVMGIKERLIAAADIGLQKLEDKLKVEGDTKVVADATDKLLQRLGYGTSKAPIAPLGGNTNNIFIVNGDDLQEARKRIMEKAQGNNIVIDHNSEVQNDQTSLPAPQVPENTESAVGEVQSLSALLLET